jgi:DNA-binding CsgD family transcriptional regulator
LNLVARDVELRLLREILENCARGAGSVILCAGASGSGKTALAQTAVEMAHNAKFVTMTASAVAPEKECDVLDQLWHNASHSPPAGTDFVAGCRELARMAPLLIVVDDADLADPGSVRRLHELARRLRTSPMCLLLTRCDSRDAGDWWTDLERQPHARHVTLGPLPSDVAGFDLTGGNPLLLAALPHGEAALGRAVVRCLHRAGRRSLAVARGVAVLGDDADVGSLSALLDMDVSHVTDTLRVLDTSGVLAGHRFRCAATAIAVLADMPDEAATSLRHRGALVLHEHGAPADVVARHLLDNATTRPWAVPVLEEAAEHADPESAARYLTRALTATYDAKAMARVRMRLATLLWETDPAAVLRHVPPLVHACRSRWLSGTHAATVCHFLLWHGRLDEAMALLKLTADGGVPWDADTPLALRVARLRLAVTYPGHAKPMAPARTRDGASPLGRRLRGLATFAQLLAEGPDEETVARAEQLIQTATDHENTLPGLWSLVYADRADTAAERSAGLPETPAFAAVRAEIALRLGDLPGAAALAAAALADLPTMAWGVTIGAPLGTSIAAATALGRMAEAEELLRRPVPDAMFASRFALPYLHARGSHHLAVGRPAAALADFLACGDLMRDWVSAPVPWRASAAHALLALDRTERARQLLAELPVNQGQRTKGIMLRATAATTAPTRRVPLLHAAVAALTVAKDRLELAYALADLAHAKQEVGDQLGVRPVLRRAYALAVACGAEPLCRRLRPAKHGVARMDGSLTKAERRVADLAAGQYTNREIADRLHVTTSTVEQHLTRVFRKLDVKHRQDLAPALRRHPA